MQVNSLTHQTICLKRKERKRRKLIYKNKSYVTYRENEQGNTRLVVLSVEIHKAEVCAIAETNNQQPQIKHTNRFIKFVLIAGNFEREVGNKII